MNLLHIIYKDRPKLLLLLQHNGETIKGILSDKIPQDELVKIKQEKTVDYQWLKKNCPRSIANGYRTFKADNCKIISQYKV